MLKKIGLLASLLTVLAPTIFAETLQVRNDLSDGVVVHYWQVHEHGASLNPGERKTLDLKDELSATGIALVKISVVVSKKEVNLGSLWISKNQFSAKHRCDWTAKGVLFDKIDAYYCFKDGISDDYIIELSKSNGVLRVK